MNDSDSFHFEKNSSTDEGQLGEQSRQHCTKTITSGPDLQESSHGYGSGSSSISSNYSSGKEFIGNIYHPNTSNSSRIGGATHLGARLLIDPATGQHYYVPTIPSQTQQPPILYQPIYYTTPTTPRPIYYTQGAYVVPLAGNQPQSVQIFPTQNDIAYTTGMVLNPVTTTHSNANAFSAVKEDGMKSLFSPRSVLESFRSPALTDSEQQRIRGIPSAESSLYERSQIYEASGLVSDSKLDKDNESTHRSHKHYEDVKCRLSDIGRLNGEKVAASELQQKSYATVPSSVTSWSVSDDEGADRVPPSRVTSAEFCVTIDEHKKIRPKPIRMDIDLNSSFLDENSKKKEATKTSAKHQSTAFTISFDLESNDSASISLQDAAKKSNSRRLQRRSAPTACSIGRNLDRELHGATDPKQYLFKKMLMGDVSLKGNAASGGHEFLSAHYAKSQPDNDTISEAGTYVVENSDRLKCEMVSSQCLSDEDDAEDSSSSSGEITPTKKGQFTPLSTSMTESSKSTFHPSRAVKDEGMDVLRGLLRSNREPQRTNVKCDTVAHTCAVASSTNHSAGSIFHPVSGIKISTLHSKKTRGNMTGQSSSAPTTQRMCCLNSDTSRALNAAKSTEPSSRFTAPKNIGFKNSEFRRGDGGRFSMRSCSNSAAKGLNPSTSRNISSRPPFRVGGSTRPCAISYGSGNQRESAEMLAWLRRKDYNPMKAAAEARKIQQIKARTDNYNSSRSVSFHQGTSRQDPSLFAWNHKSSNLRSKFAHNMSHHNLANDQSCSTDTMFNVYSKDVSEDIKKLRLVEALSHTEVPVLGLERTIQDLTVKCNRSIELIKCANQGELSKSIESLLDNAIELSKESEISLTDQLDRLSSAFDAIQKYLEAFSTSVSVPASPSCVTSFSIPSSPLRSISSVAKSSTIASANGASESNLIMHFRS